VVVPTIAADNMSDLEQLRRVTPFMCNIRFRNNLPEVCSSGVAQGSQGPEGGTGCLSTDSWGQPVGPIQSIQSPPLRGCFQTACHYDEGSASFPTLAT